MWLLVIAFYNPQGQELSLDQSSAGVYRTLEQCQLAGMHWKVGDRSVRVNARCYNTKDGSTSHQ